MPRGKTGTGRNLLLDPLERCHLCNRVVENLDKHLRFKCELTWKARCEKCPFWEPYAFTEEALEKLRDMHARTHGERKSA